MLKRIWIPQVIAILMLLWALYPDNPYGYYRLLRIVCTGVFLFLTFKSIVYERFNLVWVLAVFAVIYNPLFPLHMSRPVWSVINIITAVLLAVSIIFLKVPQDE